MTISPQVAEIADLLQELLDEKQDKVPVTTTAFATKPLSSNNFDVIDIRADLELDSQYAYDVTFASSNGAYLSDSPSDDPASLQTDNHILLGTNESYTVRLAVGETRYVKGQSASVEFTANSIG